MLNNPNNWLNRKREYSKMSEDSMQTAGIIIQWVLIFGGLIAFSVILKSVVNI